MGQIEPNPDRFPQVGLLNPKAWAFLRLLSWQTTANKVALIYTPISDIWLSMAFQRVY